MTKQCITTGTAESFETFLTDEFIYVDKTGPISALAANKGSFLLSRPRRMGKSTMVSTLKYLFSNGPVTQKKLAWDDHWTDPNRYFVFSFDFNEGCKDSSPSSVDNFKSSILSDLNVYADYFGLAIPTNQHFSKTFKQVILGCIEKLSDESFLAEHPKLADGDRPLCRNKVVLLIDEYDAPLTETLDDPKEFDKLRAEYKLLFSAIKNLKCFRFVFITGVSSYSQTSIFSGPNQFRNISLDSDYATCCGYTRDEIEHYFADALDRAQQVCNLESREQLFDLLSYYYDGYIFSNEEASFVANEDKKLRLFSPVSISSFLDNPKKGFWPYWASTGAQSTFVFKMMKLCNKAIASMLLQTFYRSSTKHSSELKALFSGVIESFFPIFSLSINIDEDLDANNSLIKINVEQLIVKLGDSKVLTPTNAVVILFQSGYLTIKKVEGSTAYLGLANHEVAHVLSELLKNLLQDKEEHGQEQLSAAEQQIFYLLNNPEDAFEQVRQGGQALAELIDDTFNCIDKTIFDKENNERLLTSVLAYMLKATGYGAMCEVKSMFGIADFVIFKPKTKALVPDVVIEFKFARNNGSVNRLLDEGSKQVANRKYGLSFLNSNPHRYCIVLSSELKGVGAISRVHRDGTYTTEYKCPQLQ